jgi:site-specific DNA-methyltransferase (adenine-specific)
MVSKALMSSKKQDWQTPREFWNKLNEAMNFTMDCASLEYNAMCQNFRGPDSPKEWSAEGESALWLNPPYSPTKLCRSLVVDTLDRAEEAHIPCAILIPARTDTKLWQEVVFKRCVVWFIEGRLTFVNANPDGTSTTEDPAPFPTAVAFGGYMECEQFKALRELVKREGGTLCRIF